MKLKYVLVSIFLMFLFIENVNAATVGCSTDEKIWLNTKLNTRDMGMTIQKVTESPSYKVLSERTYTSGTAIYDDAVYGTLKPTANSAAMFGSPFDLSYAASHTWMLNTKNVLNNKIVIDDVNNEVQIFMLGFVTMWRNSQGVWVKQQMWDDTFKTISSSVPKPFGLYNVSGSFGVEGAKDFLNTKKNYMVSIKYADLDSINNFKDKYISISKPTNVSSILAVSSMAALYSPKSGQFYKENTSAINAFPLAATTTKFALEFRASFRSNFVNGSGITDEQQPASGMGLNVKYSGSYCKVLGTVYFIPFIITVKYDDKCDAAAASLKPSASTDEYWTMPSGNSGLPGSETYKPTTKMVDTCTCGTTTVKADPTFAVFRDDANGGTVNVATPNMKVSCGPAVCDITKVSSYTASEKQKCCDEVPRKAGFDNAIVCPPAEDPTCDIAKYGTYSATKIQECCDENPRKAGFDAVCPVSQTYDLYCTPSNKLTETKTYKSIANEITDTNTACSITCSETGTPTFKTSPYVVAGQGFDYDWIFASSRSCTARYKNTPTSWVTMYDGYMTSRVSAYDTYKTSEKDHSDYSKMCKDTNKHVWYTCETGWSLSDKTCSRPTEYSVSSTITTNYSCSAAKTWSQTTSTCSGNCNAACPDGTGTSATTSSTSGSAPSGACTSGSTTTGSSTVWTKYCKGKDETKSADSHCECTDLGNISCGTYDSNLQTKLNKMNTDFGIYTSRLSLETATLNYKNICDNWINDYTVKGNFELVIKEFPLEKREDMTKTRTAVTSNVLSNTAAESKTIGNCAADARSTTCISNNRISSSVYTSWVKDTAYNYLFTYPDAAYIDRSTGALTSATGSNLSYFGGYKYYTWLGTLTGNDYNLDVVMKNDEGFGAYEQWDFKNIPNTSDKGVDCQYSIDNLFAPDNDDDNYKKYGNLGFTFRAVNLKQLFPGREPGNNWNGEESLITKIQDEGESIYNKTPKYKITLTPAAMKSVRSYTAKDGNGYSDWAEFDFDNEKGVSGFLKDIETKSSFGVKMTVND